MRQVLKGSPNVSVDVYIIDSTDGTPELGVLFNTAGMDLEYRRESSAVVDITEATLAALTTAHADGGFLEIGHGLYRLDVPDAAFATGAETVSIQGTVTGMIVLPQTIQLVDFDPEDGVRLGLTALPNAAADAALGLPISDAGGLDLDARLDAAVSSRLAPTVASRTLDVSAAGEAGLDWANIGSPTTAQNLSGTNIDVDQIVASVSGNVDGNVAGSVGSNLELGPAEVNTEVSDVFKTDTIAERSSGAPTATPTFEEAISYMFMMLTNKIDVDSGFKEFNNNAGTVIWKKALTDDASNYVEANGETGP